MLAGVQKGFGVQVLVVVYVFLGNWCLSVQILLFFSASILKKSMSSITLMACQSDIIHLPSGCLVEVTSITW